MSRANDDAEQSDEEELAPMSRANDDAEQSDEERRMIPASDEKERHA
ncbi:MAG: hypothetical protein QOE52_2887 [Mycobacterium sp.]|jgi:hypothetical protein|nr:hypothetical protein [Mycobacterium sp.]